MIGYDNSMLNSDSLLAICDSLYGCLDVTSCNYDSLALYEDGSCYTPFALTINGSLQPIEVQPTEYSVPDYFPGSTLVWFAENGTILSQHDSVAVVEWSGNPASLCVYEMLGETCQSDTTCISIDVIGSVDQADAFGHVSLFPNPATDFITVQLERTLDLSWSVYSSDGRLVLDGNSVGSQVQIPTDKLSSGAYILQMTTPSRSTSRFQFVKE